MLCFWFGHFQLLDGVAETVLENGEMASGSVHVVPPMMIDHAYVAPQAGTIKSQVRKSIFVAGRINQPQIAEQILDKGQADMCGMTRAMISDADMPNKARQGRLEQAV